VVEDKELDMPAFHRLLVPTDLGEASGPALLWAVELATKLGAKLWLLHVCEIAPYAYAGGGFTSVDLVTPIEDAARERLERCLDDVKARLPEATALLRRGSAETEILAAIEETHADVVVMGTHGRRGLSHALLGSVAERIVQKSPVPVLTAGSNRMPDIRRILCPTDFEPSSSRAIDMAVELARRVGASITLVHVYDSPVYAYSGVPFMPVVDTAAPIEKAAQAALDAAVEDLKRRIENPRGILRRGRAWEEILATAKETEADLIVMGTHGRRGLPHALLGSVAEKVVRLSPVPVLTARDAAARPAG
jgi:nucleotide-binding universal stress UspA family protein